MAQKTLQEFFAPSLENIPTGPRFEVEEGAPEFELKSSLVNLVQATQFSGKAQVDKDAILLRLFPFSLEGRPRKWFYTNQENINTCTNLSDTFLAKFFPIGKTVALRGNIVSFQQQKTNHSSSMRVFSRIHIRLSSPWNGQMVTYANHLPWINPKVS